MTLLERFMAKVDTSGECWLWTGYRNHDGYGRFKVDGRMVMAHRVAYETFVGSIPDDREIDHLCRVRSCVNPAHLEAVTHAENTRRGQSFVSSNAAKSHCAKGHRFDASNTYQRPAGGRQCRICNREAVVAYQARKKASAA